MSDYDFAVVLVLIAAFLHALWNALIKGASDRIVMLGAINVGHGVLGTLMVLLFLPPAAESWGFVAASTFIHFFYYALLLRAYQYGDLSHVYPIARGIAPILVSLGAFIFAGEVLPTVSWLGILLVSMGIGIIYFSQNRLAVESKAVIAALGTGASIAAYSIVDGLGVRASGNALGYIGWLFLLEFISGFGLLYLRRQVLLDIRVKTYMIGVVGGLVSATAYGLAIYAKNLTTLGTVSALRESSVIIAALIGVVWFGERPWKPRIFAAAVVAVGVVLLATAN